MDGQLGMHAGTSGGSASETRQAPARGRQAPARGRLARSRAFPAHHAGVQHLRPPSLENMTGPAHIGDVARGAGTPRSGGAAERRLDGIAYVAPESSFSNKTMR